MILESLSSTPIPDGGILTWAGWQGVAGLAQIVAGVLAAVTVLQSSAMMREANRQRRETEKLRQEAVSPHWQVFPQPAERLASDQTICCSEVHFLNDGYGSAQKVETFYFYAGAGRVASLSGVSSREGGEVILPGDLYILNIEWEVAHRLRGVLFLESTTRVGTKTRDEFKVETHIEDMTPSIKITPAMNSG